MAHAPQRPVRLEPGAVLSNGRYRVGAEINRGGTAVVYEGFDNALSMRVALKARARGRSSSSLRPVLASRLASHATREREKKDALRPAPSSLPPSAGDERDARTGRSRSRSRR